MTTRNISATATTRLTAFFAAIAVTTLIFGSQFGLAGHYASEAGATIMAKRAAPVAQNTASPVTQQAGQRT